jgi:hypothetical protein
MAITQAERAEWFKSPVTQDFLQKLRDDREFTKETWAKQGFLDREDSARSDRLNLYALAGIDILDQVLTMAEGYRLNEGETS